MNKLSIIFLIVLIVSICIPFYPVSADTADKYAPMIGVKQVKDNNVDIVYTGKHSKDSKGSDIYEYQATIYSVDIYTDSGSVVDCSWHTKQETTQTYDNKSGKTVYTPAIYEIKNNTFSVVVSGTQVTTTYNGEWLSWNPVVYVDLKQYTATSNANKKTDNSKNVLNINYGNNILEWDYEVCTRRITITEGKITEEYIFDKDPKGNVWIKDNATQSQGFEWEVMPYAYDSDMKPIEINEYKQVSAKVLADAKYPVVIDPTVNFTNTCYRLFNTGESDFNTAWTATSADSVYNDGTSTAFYWIDYYGEYYMLSRTAIISDTSSLPDNADISSAYFSFSSIYYWGSGDNVFNLYLYKGVTSTYPHYPAVAADYNKALISSTSCGNAAFIYPTTSQTITLNAVGRANINVAGYTKFYLRCDADVLGVAPDEEDGVTLNSIKLYVTYTASEAPTVTTNDATYLTKSSARLNGYLDADGGETCNVSFKYAFWNGSAWEANVSTSTQTGKSTGNSFYADISGLTNSSTYRFIAVAENTVGEDIGAWLNLTTLDAFSAPTDLTCQATSSSILLSWIKSDSSQVYIRYKIGSYPTDYTDGNVIANQSTNSYIHTSLTSGTSYYYKVWGLEGGNLSTTNSTCICTTTAGYTSGTTNPLPTANTSGWNETPNGSVLENNPLYGLGNMQADELGVPHNTWWLLIGIGAIVVFGIFTYTRTKDLLIAMVVVIVIGVIVAQAGIFPLWTMYIFGVTGLGFSWKELR